MNISSISTSSLFALSSTGSAGTATAVQDPDGDGDGHPRAHRLGGHGGHRGSEVGSAVASALQSLGLSLPQPAGAAPQAANSADSSSANSQDADGRSKIGDDMRTMMHALFEAVRSGQAAGSAATTGSDSTSGAAASGQPSAFSSGLSALITQVANGSAPADLQSAFAQVVQDLGGTSGTSGTTGTAASGANPSLQDFLDKLQANLGYTSTSGTGNGSLVSTQA